MTLSHHENSMAEAHSLSVFCLGGYLGIRDTPRPTHDYLEGSQCALSNSTTLREIAQIDYTGMWKITSDHAQQITNQGPVASHLSTVEVFRLEIVCVLCLCLVSICQQLLFVVQKFLAPFGRELCV